MFLHIGGDTVVPKAGIIGIFDMRAVKSSITKEFIEVVYDEGFVKDITGGSKAKSFVITDKEVFISPISCTTLLKRAVKAI